jgi:hypothetical protein
MKMSQKSEHSKLIREREKLRREKERMRSAIRAKKLPERPKKKSTVNQFTSSRMPKAPALKHAVIPVSDPVHAWSALLADPFNAPSEGVYPPISNTVVPCPSTKVRNYGTVSITLPALTGGLVPSGVSCWLYPSGTIGGTGSSPLIAVTPPQSDVDGASQAYRTIGPVLNGTTPTSINGFGSCAGFWTYINASNPDPLTAPTQTTPANPLSTFPWDDLENPFTIPGKQSDVMFKTTAFAIRITYSGKLLDTEGWVDFYNPYTWTGTTPQPRTMSSLRRDPSHRRGYFANKRTHTFVWHPNCESSNYVPIVRDDNPDVNAMVSRFMLEIGGVAPGDTFEIEYIGFQEFTGYTAVATNTPSPIAHDVVHVANAIPALQGKMNSGASNGPKSTLAQHVAASKAISLPGVKHIASGIHEAVSKVVKGPKQSFMGTLLDVALPFLDFL